LNYEGNQAMPIIAFTNMKLSSSLKFVKMNRGLKLEWRGKLGGEGLVEENTLGY
jgi:hypothetical protein